MLRKEDALTTELVEYDSIRSGKKRKQRVYIYKCIECDNLVRSQQQTLKSHSGKCNICGQRGEPFRARYNELLKNSVRRNYEITLTFEEFLTFTKINNCHYCLEHIIWYPYTRDIVNRKAMSRKYQLDRKNNDLGYTLENCVVCCTRCNYSKNARYTYEEWYGMTEYFRNKS